MKSKDRVLATWSQRVEQAMMLFNRACIYPLAMFVVATISTWSPD